MQRVPDGDLLGTFATAPRQDDDIGVFEQNKDRIGEPDRLQALPIPSGRFGQVSEFPGKLGEPDIGRLSLSGTSGGLIAAAVVGSRPFCTPNCTRQASAVSRETTGSREAVALESMSIIATEREVSVT